MVKFEQVSQKAWKVCEGDNCIEMLDLSSSSITNKFSIITSFIENVSKNVGSDFDEWFVQFLNTYKSDAEKRFVLLEDNVPTLKKFVDQYLDSKNIDFTQFVDMSKAKKTSILFDPNEIEKIIRSSSYLKLYSIFSNSENLKLDNRLHKQMYNILVSDLDKDTIFKVFNVVKTKTFRYNISDKYMWDYIKMIQCKTIDIYAVEIFNFIMNSIFTLCDENKNPISYFISVVDESVKWFLRSVYKGSVVYDDSVATEDIQAIHIDNLRTYTYNDTLGRLERIAHQKIHADLEKSSVSTFGDERTDKAIRDFDERVKNTKFVSPLCECLTFPILSMVTGIPYEHFRTLTPDRSVVISIYLQGLLKRVFKTEYESLFDIMSFYPQEQCAVHTTYKMKLSNMKDYFIPQMNSCKFLKFQDKVYLHKVLSYFVGRIARIDFIDPMTGKELVGIPLSKIEADMIRFYSLLFSGKLEEEVEELKQLLNVDF